MYPDYLSRKIRRRKIILASTVFVLITAIITTIALAFNYYKSTPINVLRGYQNASCHYETKGDALPSIDEQLLLSSKSIFYHYTSCLGRLTSRQACAIESASRTHPNWKIHVLFAGPIDRLNLVDVNFELLKLMKNVFFWRVHVQDYVKGTPVEELVRSGGLNKTGFEISFTAEMLKFLSLNKWGGVVLDMDLIVAKPFDELAKNWMVKKYESLETSAMAFDKDSVGTFVAEATLRKISKSFIEWGFGNSVTVEVLRRLCHTEDVREMNAEKCSGLEVYPEEFKRRITPPPLFYWGHIRRPNDMEPSDDLYVYQIQNYPYNVPINKTTTYAKLAKRYCPIIYNTYKDTFGV